MEKKNTFTVNVRKGGVTVNKPKPLKPSSASSEDKNKQGGK